MTPTASQGPDEIVSVYALKPDGSRGALILSAPRDKVAAIGPVWGGDVVIVVEPTPPSPAVSHSPGQTRVDDKEQGDRA